MDFEFVKDRYDFELDRKEKLTAALTLPVGVLSVLGGALTAMARSFTYSNQLVTGFFVVFVVSAVASFFVCAYRLIRAYHAQTYVYLPLLSEFERYEEEDQEWRSYVEHTGGDLSAEDDFDAWLRKRIINAADENTRSNDRRSKWLHQSRMWLFAVFCSTALAGIPYVADQARCRMASQATQAPKPGPAATTQPRPSAPPRPSFPENRVIKEGTDGGNVQKK